MKSKDLPPSPDLSIPPLPVLCDNCRATGMAADPKFSAIPDILAFVPVERRARADNWTPRHQRAFIAALAITGSPRKAARTIGKHAFGAEALRSARGGRSFAAAWDAALEIARDCETARIHTNLDGLIRDEAERHALAAAAPGATDGSRRRALAHDDDEEDEGDALRREVGEAHLRIRLRLTRARRLYLAAIADDPDRRAAWETLVAPVDWDRAARRERQDDEPFDDDPDAPLPSMIGASGLLVAENGLLADICGGEDALAPLRAIIADEAARHAAAGPAVPLPGESRADQAARLESELSETVEQRLVAKGWKKNGEGKWVSPSGLPDGEIPHA